MAARGYPGIYDKGKRYQRAGTPTRRTAATGVSRRTRHASGVIHGWSAAGSDVTARGDLGPRLSAVPMKWSRRSTCRAGSIAVILAGAALS